MQNISRECESCDECETRENKRLYPPFNVQNENSFCDLYIYIYIYIYIFEVIYQT